MARSGFEWAKSYKDAAHRLVPNVVDELAHDHPDQIVYEIAIDDDVRKPFEKITARRYANAINRVAAWLEITLGKAEGFPTVGYLGPQDLRYLILVVATIKAGYKVLFISNRNSIEGDIAVIEASSCKLWLVPSSGSNIHRVLEQVNLTTYSVPDLAWFLDPYPVPHYPYNRTWETGRRDPLWIVHTSGSTGNPKPVFRYLDSAAASGANTILPMINERPLLLHDYFNSRAYITFPFFHAAGLANGLLWPLFNGTTVLVGPQRPVELELMKDVIRHAKPDTVFTAPSIVEEIAKDEEFLNLLDKVNAIGYGGGPVSKEGGDRIWKHTRLRLSIGVSEAGNLPCVETDPEDWNYLHFHPNTGFQLQDRDSGLFELVAVRQPELAPWQPIFSTFPDLESYSTKDLFSRHPTKPNLYTYEGRADNTLVLSNGEKVQPHKMETTIAAHPLVDSALVSGQGRFQVSLLVELSKKSAFPDSEKQDIVELIWPAIAEANKSAPTHAKILKDFILLACPQKPFSKTDKGTVRRAPTLQLYQAELNALYADTKVEKLEPHDQLDVSNISVLQQGLRTLIQGVTDDTHFGDDEDFFAVGIDSLQVLTIVRALQKSIRAPEDKRSAIRASLIYRNPTVNLLARALFLNFTGSDINVEGGCLIATEGPATTVEGLFEKYALGLGSRPVSVEEGLSVVLTGSTGSLGSYLLDELMNSKRVRKIWCLNRSHDASSRQNVANAERGLRTDFHDREVEFIQISLTKKNLGLSQGDYTVLRNSATHIIHTQWQVDFNLQLGSFEPHIKGTRDLIDLGIDALSHGRHIHLFFTSSVGVANNAQASFSIPEESIKDYSIAGSGYGESKLVAEALLHEAFIKTGMNTTVSRVGQIAGPVGDHRTSGMWNRKEWLPSIIDASSQLGLLPQTLGRNESVDWIPVDILASIIVDLAVERSDAGLVQHRVFHLVNPRPVRWESHVLPIVRARLAKIANESHIGVVPMHVWVERLVEYSKRIDGQTSGQISALKLIEFLVNLNKNGNGAERPVFETKKTSEASRKLNELAAVDSEWVNIWLDQWGY